MFYIPNTKEEIRAKIKEINDHVTKLGAANMIDHFYVQALTEAFYTKVEVPTI